MLTSEYTDSDLKVHALHYANEFLVRRQSSNSVNTQKQCEKTFKGKGNDAYSLSIREQTTINHNSICFLPQYQRQRKWLFFQRASWKRHCATHWREQLVMDPYRQRPNNFWLVRPEHAHASYPGLSFRPPGLSPYIGREERGVQELA